MPADLDVSMLQQTDDAKEHVFRLEMLRHTNIEDFHLLSGVVTLVCRSSIMSLTNMVAAYLSWFKLSDVTPQEWEPSSVQGTSVKSTQGSSRHSESCLVAGGWHSCWSRSEGQLWLGSPPGKPPLKLIIVILADNDTLRLGGKVLEQGNDH